jgi:hypothetical protein
MYVNDHSEDLPINDQVLQNIELAPVLGNEVLGMVFAEIGAVGSGLIPLDEQMAAKLDEYRAKLTGIANGIDDAVPVAQRIIRSHGLMDPIDVDFLRPLLTGIIEIGEEELSSSDVIPRLVSELSDRTRIKEMEHASQASFSTTISGERVVSVEQGIDTSKLNLTLPVVMDPRQFPVELGPEAVTTILGAPLTDQDYAQIADLLRNNTTGLSNEIVLEYERAVRAWAEDLVDRGVASTDLLETRKQSSQALMRAMNFDWMTTDIAVNSIFTAILRKFPELNNIQTPQPYSD